MRTSVKPGMVLVVNGEAWKVVTVRDNGKATIKYKGQMPQQAAQAPIPIPKLPKVQPGDAELKQEANG